MCLGLRVVPHRLLPQDPCGALAGVLWTQKPASWGRDGPPGCPVCPELTSAASSQIPRATLTSNQLATSNQLNLTGSVFLQKDCRIQENAILMIIVLLSQKDTEQNQPKSESTAKILEEFQIGNFLVLGDVSHSRHPCVTVLRVLPIQDASQSSSAKDLLAFHK